MWSRTKRPQGLAVVARAATVEVVGDALARHRETSMIGARRPPMVAGSLLPHLLDLDLGGNQKKRETRNSLCEAGERIIKWKTKKRIPMPLDYESMIGTQSLAHRAYLSCDNLIAGSQRALPIITGMSKQHKPLNPQLFFSFFPTSLLSLSHTHMQPSRTLPPNTDQTLDEGRWSNDEQEDVDG